MKIEKIEASTFQIEEAPIRGFDWQLIRKPGQGTYASIAGRTDDDPDELFVIEEYDDPERRALWDGLTVMSAASAARRQILEDLGENFTETAAEIAARVGKSAQWIRILAPELEREGIAQKAGTSWLFSPRAVEYLQNRPDGRGRPKTRLSAGEMAESRRRDALVHKTGETTDELAGVLVWRENIVANAWGEILQATGEEQELQGWGKLDGTAAGYEFPGGIVWVPTRYLE